MSLSLPRLRKTINIEVSHTDTIYDIKRKIQEKQGISLSPQKLIFLCEQLEDSKSVSDYNIKRNSELHLLCN